MSQRKPDSETPILVTGLPRCGSSWVGKVLGEMQGMRYRYESLNRHWVPALQGRLRHFTYQRPGDAGTTELRNAIENALEGHQSFRQLKRAVYRGYARPALRRRGRIILKDPTACLLAAWIGQQWPLNTALLIRHPCGFASSIDALGWPFPIRRLLRQPALMEDHLAPYESIMQRAVGDPWAERGAFWAAIHKVLLAQAQDDWVITHFEHLCLQPETAFPDLFSRLGLTTGNTEGLSHVSVANDQHQDDPGSTQKNSLRMASIWKDRMSSEAIDRVMEPVAEFGLLDVATGKSIEEPVENLGC